MDEANHDTVLPFSNLFEEHIVSRYSILAHALGPVFLGIIIGFVTRKRELSHPPIFGLGDFDALFLSLLLLMLSFSILGIIYRSYSRWIDHLFGAFLSSLIFFVMVIIASICSISLVATLWAMLTTTWSSKSLPPFRHGLWHGFGACTGIVLGSILGSY